MTPPKEDGPQHTCGTMGDACSQACAAWTPRQRGPPPVSADSFLAVVHQRDEARYKAEFYREAEQEQAVKIPPLRCRAEKAEAALSVAREALEKARALAAKAMNISQNEDPNWRRDLEDTLWLLAYCPAPQPSTVEPPKTFTLVDKTPGCGDCGHSWLMHCGPCNETGCPCADFVEPTP